MTCGAVECDPELAAVLPCDGIGGGITCEGPRGTGGGVIGRFIDCECCCDIGCCEGIDPERDDRPHKSGNIE